MFACWTHHRHLPPLQNNNIDHLIIIFILFPQEGIKISSSLLWVRDLCKLKKNQHTYKMILSTLSKLVILNILLFFNILHVHVHTRHQIKICKIFDPWFNVWHKLNSLSIKINGWKTKDDKNNDMVCECYENRGHPSYKVPESKWNIQCFTIHVYAISPVKPILST